MAYTQKDNSGSLFRNEQKSGPRDKDYGGSCLIKDPGEYWMNAWVQTSKPDAKGNVKKYLAVKFVRKPDPVQDPVAQPASPEGAAESEQDGESLPF